VLRYLIAWVFSASNPDQERRYAPSKLGTSPEQLLDRRHHEAGTSPERDEEDGQ
jgi:hypothetical protein